MLGRLFSNQRDERNKTEIVLLITPRVLRSDATRQPAQTEFRGGTENTIGGGLAAAPFAPAMEQMQPPALPAGTQVEPLMDTVAPPDAVPAVPDAVPAMPVPQIPPPPAQGE